MRITLAPPPAGIIWKNLTKSRASRAKSSFFGFLMLLVLFFMNTFPLIAVSLLSNMAGLTSISWLGWLKDWQQKSSFTFAAVSVSVLPSSWVLPHSSSRWPCAESLSTVVCRHDTDSTDSSLDSTLASWSSRSSSSSRSSVSLFHLCPSLLSRSTTTAHSRSSRSSVATPPTLRSNSTSTSPTIGSRGCRSVDMPLSLTWLR